MTLDCPLLMMLLNLVPLTGQLVNVVLTHVLTHSLTNLLTYYTYTYALILINLGGRYLDLVNYSFEKQHFS